MARGGEVLNGIGKFKDGMTCEEISEKLDIPVESVAAIKGAINDIPYGEIMRLQRCYQADHREDK